VTSRAFSATAAAAAALITIAAGTRLHAQHAVRRALDGRPDAVVDLRTSEGIRLVRGQWRYHEAAIVEADFRAPGPDLRPSGRPIRTRDLEPKAGRADFDDSGWEAIEPAALESRRSTGKLCFNWYRTSITIPERVGTFDTTGATVVFEIVVDDYAEVWVDGRLPRVLGQSGGPLMKGFNAPNRVVLTTSARPGQTIQIAVLGANGPLSDPPSNFIWVRSATLDFYKPGATDRGARRGRDRRSEGRSAWKRVRVGAGRALDSLARRETPRHDRRPRTRAQLRLG
jgi:hypothetical protein